MFALNLDTDGRILSATYPEYAPADAVTVEALPEGNISDYLYQDGEFIYNPLPEPEPPEPTEAAPTWDELAAAIQEGVNDI